MNKVLTPAMKMRLDWLDENQPWEYQGMKDHGTMLTHLQEVNEAYSEAWEQERYNLIRSYNQTHEVKFNDLPWTEKLKWNNTFLQQAREIAQEQVLFRPMQKGESQQLLAMIVSQMDLDKEEERINKLIEESWKDEETKDE